MHHFGWHGRWGGRSHWTSFQKRVARSPLLWRLAEECLEGKPPCITTRRYTTRRNKLKLSILDSKTPDARSVTMQDLESFRETPEPFEGQSAGWSASSRFPRVLAPALRWVAMSPKKGKQFSHARFSLVKSGRSVPTPVSCPWIRLFGAPCASTSCNFSLEFSFLSSTLEHSLPSLDV